MSRTLIESSSSSNTGRATVRITDTGAVECEFYDYDNDLEVTLTTADGLVPSDNSAWRHVAVTRNADGLYTIWVEGVPHAASVRTGINIAASNQNYIIGASNFGGTLSDYYSGYIDELRITEGVARYEPTITVPTAEPDGAAQNVDAFLDNVVLLLNCNGVDGSTTLTDSSPRPATVSAFSGASLSTTRQKFGSASLRLDGVNDYVSTNRSQNIGPGAFTLEAHVRPTAAQTGRIISSQSAISVNPMIAFRVDADGSLTLQLRNSSGTGYLFLFSAPGLIAMNDSAWYHVAATRNDAGRIDLWVNGVSVANATSSTSPAGAPGYLIGSFDASQEWFAGYIDDVRITEGACRYTATFTPPQLEFPSSPSSYVDTNLSSVVLLLKGDGSEGSTTIVDSSNSAKTPSTNTGVQIATGSPKFGTGSLDGVTSPQLIYASSTDFNRRAVFTLECWVRWSTGQEGFLLAKSPVLYANVNSGGSLSFTGWSGGSLSTSLTNGVWHHIALASDGTNARLFRDGVLIDTVAALADDLAAQPFAVFGVPTRPDLIGFNGNLEQVRFTQGVCRYVSAFPQPALEFPTQAGGASSDPLINDVWLLLNCNGANASTTFIDSSPNNRTVTAFGGAQITTTNPRFGSGAAIFDGNGDYLLTAGAPPIGTGDFTIECWAFIVAGTGSQALVCAGATPGGPNGPWRLTSQSGNIVFTTLVGAQIDYSASKPHPVGSWFHVAVVRQSGVLRIFVAGEMLFAGPATSDLSSALSDVSVGALLVPGGGGGVSPEQPLNGRIDALRITVGHARYSASFTPPAEEFPLGGGGVGVGDFSDFGSAGWAISKNGTAVFNNLYARGAIASGGFGLANWNWPASGGGFHIGPQGIRLGRESSGSWLELGSDGNVRAPGFTIIGGNATFSGALSAATGTFAGSLAANVVNTENIVGAAVTSVSESSTSGFSTSVTVTVAPGDRSLVIIAGGSAGTGVTGGKDAVFYTDPGTIELSSPLGSAVGSGSALQSFTNPPAGTYTITATRSRFNVGLPTSFVSPLSLVVLRTRR